MEQRRVGRSGLLVSRLGLGTMTWGRDTDEIEAAGQLHDFLDAGGTLLDTAAGYGGGAAEEVLGELLSGAVSREEVVICTRGGRRRGAWVDTSRRAMLSSLDESLGRLRIEAVDLWLAPGWNPAVPVEETLSALEQAVSSGRACYAGVSNYSGWQTALAAGLGPAGGSPAGRAGLVATSMEYSLVQRGVEREVLPAAQALGLGVLAGRRWGGGC
jgi:aryl-alcohol dehydrogenase-like predicted oxidoreductase